MTLASPSPLITDSVWIQIIEPGFLQNGRARLVLRRYPMGLYKEDKQGEIWLEINSIQTLKIVIDKKSSEYFLYPPLGVREGEANF
jgi:hypothetical protein